LSSLNTDNEFFPYYQLFLIAIAQIGISIGIVSLASFVNSSLRFLDWSPDVITLVLGATAIFELIRLPIARLSDYLNQTKIFFLIGLVTTLIGFSSIPFFVDEVDNYKIILPVALFYGGTAIMSTLVDTHLTKITKPDRKDTIASILQITRLSGFALGGIVGAIIWTNVDFVSFIYIISTIIMVLFLISYLSINDSHIIIDAEHRKEIEKYYANKSTSMYLDMDFKQTVKTKPVLLMSAFLLMYPIAIFMQDFILELYAIDVFGFQEDGIGRLVIIWTTMTLFFVPFGPILAKKIGRIQSLVIGQIIAIIGLSLILISGFSANIILLYLGLLLFGSGAGIFSVPGISYMLAVAALFPKNIATLLGVFGVYVTIGRALSAFISSMILRFTDNNYQIAFSVEIVILALTTLFIIPLSPLLDQNDNDNLKTVHLHNLKDIN
jgi:MFS family permease